jgi:hypothetical protein
MDITIQNMIINGANYNGVINVSSKTVTGTLTFDNVTYRGPRLAHYQNGPVAIRNSSMMIGLPTNVDIKHSVVECASITLGGTVTILRSAVNGTYAYNLDDNIFNMYPAMGLPVCFTVEDNANVYIEYTQKLYDGTPVKPITSALITASLAKYNTNAGSVSIGTNANLQFKGLFGIIEGCGLPATNGGGTFTINDGASFDSTLITNKTCVVPVSSFTVGNGARFSLTTMSNADDETLISSTGPINVGVGGSIIVNSKGK